MEAKESTQVSELGKEYSLVTSDEARAVRESIGAGRGWNGYGVAFVKVGNGDYDEVWLASGVTAFNWKTAYRLV